MEKQSTRKFLKLIVALVALFLLGASALMLASCNKDEHVHSYKSSVTTPATCSNPGVETFTCSCGLTYTQIIPATGEHSWEKVKEYPASCESEGWTVYECSVCHTQKQDDWVQKRDHKYEAVETVEATCTTDGYQIMQCSYCGDRYTDDQYSSEHKATGHKWIVNESPADPADLTDAEGWKVVSPADCLNAAQLERECSVCHEKEQKTGAAATGHMVTVDGKLTVKTDNLCKVNEQLVDAEGNKVYAFECENENCPVEVKVDARGNTKHFIKAVDHKMKTIEEHINCEDTDKDKSYILEICENCDTWSTAEPKKTEVAAAGHKWNSVQSNGTDDVVVCIEDKGINTQDKYLAFMRNLVGNSTFADNQDMYIKAWEDAKADEKNTAAVDEEKGTFAISRVCTRCGKPTAALGHDYVVAKYVEGSFTDVEKDEDGAIVDYSEEVNVATMNCRYVQLCSGCGDVAKRGAHQNVPAATCRENGVCPDCGRPVNAQLSHQYVNVSSFVNAKGEFISATTAFNGLTVKAQDAYDAWKKLSATETWLVPVVGDCDSKSTDVTVCVQCLVDAAKGTEVAWNQATEKPEKLPTEATSTNAYVVTLDNTHDYQPFYYDLDGTEIEWNMTNCQIGYLVRYECSKCREVYKNVLVADDPATTAENTDKGENGEELWNEARNNKYAELTVVKGNGDEETVSFFTDDEGFVLNIQPVGDYTAEKVKAEGFKTTGVAQEDNKDKHSLYLEKDYKAIKAATCATYEDAPFYCENCGQVIEMTVGTPDADGKHYFGDTAAASEGKNNTFTYAEVTAENGRVAAQPAYDKTNHAGKPEECGVHCDYKVNNQLVCSGYGDVAVVDRPAKVHDTFTITYELMSTIRSYYENYTLQVARVGDEPINPALTGEKDTLANHLIGLYDGTMVSKCLGNAFALPTLLEYKPGETEVPEDAEYIELLVLVDEDGNMYQVKGERNVTSDDTSKALTFYTEDASAEGKPAGGIVPAKPQVNGDDTYFVAFTTKNAGTVTAAPVSASDSISLGLALGQAAETVKENGKDVDVLTVEVAKSFELKNWPTLPTKDPADSTSTNPFRVVFDLGGNTLTFNVSTQTAAMAVSGNLTFMNGNVTVQNPNGKAAFSVANGGTLTMQDVVLTTSGSAVVAQPTATGAGGIINLKDTTIYAGTKGTPTIAVSTNATNSDDLTDTNKVTMNIENTNIYMYPATATSAADYIEDSTPLLVNVPADVTIKGSTLVGTRQAVVVRGGDVEISDSTLSVVRVPYSGNATSNPGSLNQAWGQGTLIPAGVLVLGTDDNDTTKAESTADAYQYKTTVILSDDVVLNVTDTANATSKVVIASDFADGTLVNAYNKENKLEGDKAITAVTQIPDGKMPVMVYLNGAGVVSGSDISYVRTWDKGTTQLVNCGDMSGIR